jgi:sugar lactone lactonase YvrE
MKKRTGILNIQMRKTLAGLLFASAALSACGDDSGSVFDQRCEENQESGTACTWLGLKGFEGFNGNGLPRLETQVNQVQDMVFMPDGTAWFTDFQNFQVRRVMQDDTVVAMVGWDDPVFPGDGPVGGIPPEGAAGTDWQLNHPTNILMQPNGDILLVGWHNHKLLNIDPDDGYVTVIAGGGAGFKGDGEPAKNALFKQVQDAAFDTDGNMYIVDQQNQRMRMIDTDGIMSTMAGTGTPGFSGDGGPALEAELYWGFGSNPNPSGGVTVADDGMLYFSDSVNHRVRSINLETGIIDTVAGTGEEGFSGDGGPAVDAQINNPHDLEIGPDGDLYIADTDNGAVRAVDLDSGIIRTIIGNGELGLNEEEGIPATEAQLRRPFGVSFDPEGNLYVMDTLNSRVVKIAK